MLMLLMPPEDDGDATVGEGHYDRASTQQARLDDHHHHRYRPQDRRRQASLSRVHLTIRGGDDGPAMIKRSWERTRGCLFWLP